MDRCIRVHGVLVASARVRIQPFPTRGTASPRVSSGPSGRAPLTLRHTGGRVVYTAAVTAQTGTRPAQCNSGKPVQSAAPGPAASPWVRRASTLDFGLTTLVSHSNNKINPFLLVTHQPRCTGALVGLVAEEQRIGCREEVTKHAHACAHVRITFVLTPLAPSMNIDTLHFT